MNDHAQDLLRLQPQMIPAVRSAFSTAVDQVEAALLKLSREGYLPSPWLGDEVSSEVAAHYTNRALRDEDSSYHALQRYRAELARVHDTLQRMEDDYRRTEGDNAALWGLRA